MTSRLVSSDWNAEAQSIDDGLSGSSTRQEFKVLERNPAEKRGSVWLLEERVLRRFDLLAVSVADTRKAEPEQRQNRRCRHGRRRVDNVSQ